MKKKNFTDMKQQFSAWNKKNWPFVLFVVLNLIGVYFHECWRDEVQSLLIAKVATGPWDLITHTLRYEGHPALWHLMLRYFTGSGVNPMGMQLLNSLLIICTAAIFWWRFPLNFTLRALFMFNYFFVFEYGILARSYTLGLFLFFFSIAFMDDPKKWLRTLSFIALLLMPQTSIYGALIACGLMAYRFMREGESHIRPALWKGGLFLLSLGLAAWQMIPPADGGFAPGWNVGINFGLGLEVLQRFGQVFLFIPQFNGFPLIWDSQPQLMSTGIARVAFVLMLLGVMCWRLWVRDRKLLLGFLCGFVPFYLFCYSKYLGGLRHGAHLLFLVAGFYWIANRVRPWVLSQMQQIILVCVATLSAVSGLTLWLADVFYPFSDAKQASKVLRENRDFTIAWPDYIGSTLSAYLDGRELFYFEGMRKGTYVIWDANRGSTVPPSLEDFEVWIKDRGMTSLIFATNNMQVAPFLAQRFLVDSLYKSTTCIVTDECYEIMRVSIIGARSGAQPNPKKILHGPRDVANDPAKVSGEVHDEEAIKVEKK